MQTRRKYAGWDLSLKLTLYFTYPFHHLLSNHYLFHGVNGFAQVKHTLLLLYSALTGKVGKL